VSRTEAERAWLRTVGMRVRLARVGRRESQAELGERSAVARVTVGSVDRGDHPAVVLAYIRLARAIDVPLGELLDGAL
jgi:transcriptional regulator with XRE-family HTH domain